MVGSAAFSASVFSSDCTVFCDSVVSSGSAEISVVSVSSGSTVTSGTEVTSGSIGVSDSAEGSFVAAASAVLSAASTSGVFSGSTAGAGVCVKSSSFMPQLQQKSAFSIFFVPQFGQNICVLLSFSYPVISLVCILNHCLSGKLR